MNDAKERAALTPAEALQKILDALGIDDLNINSRGLFEGYIRQARGEHEKQQAQGVDERTPSDEAAHADWQDISTAPRDGTKILLLDENGCGSGYWHIDGWMADWGNYYEYEPEATHWMPIPALEKHRQRREGYPHDDGRS